MSRVDMRYHNGRAVASLPIAVEPGPVSGLPDGTRSRGALSLPWGHETRRPAVAVRQDELAELIGG